MKADSLALRYRTHPDYEDLRQEARLAELKGGGSLRIIGSMKDALRKRNVVRWPRKRDADDKAYMEPIEIVPITAHPTVGPQPHFLKELSARQLQVARLTALGMVESEIAKKLRISVNTVRQHRHRIYQKLGIRTERGRGAISMYQALGKAVIERIPCPKCGFRRGL